MHRVKFAAACHVLQFFMIFCRVLPICLAGEAFSGARIMVSAPTFRLSCSKTVYRRYVHTFHNNSALHVRIEQIEPSRFVRIANSQSRMLYRN